MNNVKKLVYASLFIALGIIIPYACGHAFGIPGTVLLPMHFTVFIGGMLLGAKYGLLIGIITPILSMLITGMPNSTFIYIMASELAVYGLVSGLLHKKLKMNVYASLSISMICGRIAYAIALFALVHIFNMDKAANIAGVFTAITTGAAGITLHFIIVPILVNSLKRGVFND